MTPEDQVELINNIKNHNTSSFKIFYDQWDERVYFFFLKKTADVSKAEELSHQTFIKFWRYRHTLTPEITIEAQLFQRARLVFIDWLRTEASLRKQKDAAWQFYANKTNDPGLQHHHTDLENALHRLPPMRRKVIELSYLKGYKYKEIARELQISVKTVDNHIYQALKQLRKYLSFLSVLMAILLK